MRFVTLLSSSILMLSMLSELTQAQALRHDPFIRPNLNALADRTDAGSNSPLNLDLRATVMAGKNSVANIDGQLYRIGAEVGGFVLIAIEEGAVVLSRGEERKRLTVHGNDSE